jgi:hypothetical protein
MIHRKPFSGNFTIQIVIADCGALQLGAEGFGAPVRHKVLHCLVDEFAALAGFDQPVNGPDRGFRQNDVDAFGHGDYQ